jgi:MFS family permease
MAQFLQTALGHGPLATGLGLMPWGATTVFVPPIAGTLISRVGERPLIVAGLSLNAAAMAWIALIAALDLAYWQLVAPLIISGTGVAMASSAALSSVMSSVAPQLMGKASGTLSTLRQLGGALGVTLSVAVFAAAGGYASRGVQRGVRGGARRMRGDLAAWRACGPRASRPRWRQRGCGDTGRSRARRRARLVSEASRSTSRSRVRSDRPGSTVV